MRPDEDWGVLPWKRFANLFVAQADVIECTDAESESFEEYELQRSWWLNVRQLQKFVSSQ